MARLIVTSEGIGVQAIELRLGINRFGRSSDNDFQIEHPTISASHCEVTVEEGEVVVRDCGSTNGTFVAGEPIQEARLAAGQSFSLGDVEFFVESTEMTVEIPKFDIPRPAPPVVLSDGSLICPRHPEAHVTHQCTHCREVMCTVCVHHLRRRGGRKVLELCPLCSHPVAMIGGEKKQKKRFFKFLHTTIKLPFIHSSKNVD